jgi:hypothetical protein
VTFVGLLPQANRLAFIASDGIHVEQSAPSPDDPAWIRTSRIRYDTTEMKLFRTGRITGTLDSSSIQVSAITPFSGTKILGTFGFLLDGNSGDFDLPSGLYEWIQLQLTAARDRLCAKHLSGQGLPRASAAARHHAYG